MTSEYRLYYSRSRRQYCLQYRNQLRYFNTAQEARNYANQPYLQCSSSY